MSVLPFELFMLLLIIGLIVLLFVPTILRAATAIRRASRIANSPERSAEASVLSKRVEVSAIERGKPEQRHFATFQFPSGERVEFELTGHQFGLLAEADQGTLTWKGPRYVGFTREIMR
ncbi:DUF2500 domain-containing protein [Propionicimonas paludicola]|uniref:DUF2500 domain-containing protein n=1 Tax=Propionicimonas paludicola TaxID=185243 RepID=UPI000BF9AAFA|nr:DUF2500 domain-containing protein [Propionicimonas paludicola]